MTGPGDRPRRPRADLATVVARKLGPPIAVHIVLRLPAPAGQERRTPSGCERLCQEPAAAFVKRTTWTEFLKTHWDVLAAADFFTVDVWTCRGLTRFAVLFIIELSTRRVEIAGITSEPDATWMTQVSRNVTDVSDGFLTGKRFLIHDRDPLVTGAFRETLASAGVEVVRPPPRSPNLNAYAERFVRSVKESCPDRLILVGEESLRRTLRESVARYHHERYHQGLGNQLILPMVVQTKDDGCIVSRASRRPFVILVGSNTRVMSDA